MIIKNPRSLMKIWKQLEDMHLLHQENQIDNGIEEYDDDFITNDMDDILSAIHVLKEALDYKSNYPKNVLFSGQEEVFVNYAIENLKGLHTHIK